MRVRSLFENRVLCGALGVAGLLCLLEAGGRTGVIDPLVFPLISGVVARAATFAIDPEFLADIAATLTAWAAGLLLATLIAVPAGLVLGTMPRVEAAVRPITEFLRPIPSIALVSLAALVFAERFNIKVSVAVYGSMWPILINTMYGLKDVDPVAKDTLRSFGFSPFDVLRRVSLPSTAPFIATGVRLASAIALILVISAELLAGGSSGIGTFVLEAGGSIDALEFIVAAALWAGVIGLLSNGLFVLLERRLFRWHRARTETT
ncbi:ABC transporter permease [Streptosporangium sp. KLBMP 9127]|nr:ABC transporter permease [Streptosporangium sp. KLBMP 9127]